MFLNQTLVRHSLVLGLGVLAGLALLTSCASTSRGDDSAAVVGASAPRAMAPDDDTSVDEGQALTATEAAIAAQGDGAAVQSAAPSGDIIRDDAPRNYIVKRGDTLWGIASMFLRDPWLWPEVWYVNPQVKNPHLIYPGDELVLAFGANGSPQITLGSAGAARLDPRLRSEPLAGAIATIPYAAIAAFLERPTVITSDQAQVAPRVLSFRDGHMVGGTGHEAYVRNLQRDAGGRFAIVHVGEPLVDPDDGALVGYQGVYTGTAEVVNAGDPGKVRLTDAARETLAGDRLIKTETDVPLDFVPRAPDNNVDGQIISVIDGVELIGQYKIVVINRGARHGLLPGHVLAVDQAGETVRDRDAGRGLVGRRVGNAFAERVKLPDERAGTLLVFRTYDRVSYGLIVAATSPIRIADRVRTP
ncbi:MAG: LysM domain-containing protein [Steroidobacteraceae bacterium]